jgi:hypothetical protein
MGGIKSSGEERRDFCIANVLGRWLDGSNLVLKILSVSLSWFTLAHTRPLFYTGASVSEVRSSSMSRSEVGETGGRRKSQGYHSLPHDLALTLPRNTNHKSSDSEQIYSQTLSNLTHNKEKTHSKELKSVSPVSSHRTPGPRQLSMFPQILSKYSTLVETCDSDNGGIHTVLT